MGLKWGLRWYLTKRRAGGALLSLFLLLIATSAWGQERPLPLPPVESELAFRILPWKATKTSLSPEVWREQPLIHLADHLISKYFGFDLMGDLSSTCEGTFVGAVLPLANKRSSLVAYFEDSKLQAKRQALVTGMRNLNGQIQQYKEEHESYPEDWQAFIEDYSYLEPSFPQGVSYKYSSMHKGQGYRLRVIYDKKAELASLGPAPAWGDSDYEENIAPQRARFTPYYGLGIKVLDPSRGKALLTSLLGEPVDGFWQSETFPSVAATVRGEWIVVGDSKERVGAFYRSISGVSADLAKNPSFQKVARNLDAAAPALFYIDLPKYLAPKQGDVSPEFIALIKTIGPAGWSSTPLEHYQTHSKFFMALNPPKGSKLAAILASKSMPDTGAELDLDIVPWDVTDVVVVQYRKVRQIVQAVMAISPTVEEEWKSIEDVLAGRLGIEAEDSFDKLASGWVVLSYDSLGFFVNPFIDIVDSFSSPAEVYQVEEEGGPTDESAPVVAAPVDEDTESDDSTAAIDENSDVQLAEPEPGEKGEVANEPALAVEGPSQDEPSQEEPAQEEQVQEEPTYTPAPERKNRFLRSMPVMVAIKLEDERARKAFVEALNDKLGGEAKDLTICGVVVRQSQEGDISYAQRGRWLYLSAGNTGRLLRNFLLRAANDKDSLLSLESWQKFYAGYGAKAFAVVHQKIDVSATLAKAFLLYMGPEFRELANQVGSLRDSYAAFMLNPEGIVMVQDVYKGDGR